MSVATDVRRDRPRDYWQQGGPQIEFGREHFRVWWIPPTGSKAQIDTMTEEVTWDDSTAILSGTIRVRDPADGPTAGVGFGGQIMLEASTTGTATFQELWRMWIVEPNTDYGSATRTFQMENALGFLARSTDSFLYQKDKQHPKGWLASEIAIDVAQRYKMPLGVIGQTKHYITRIAKVDVSPLDVIAYAYKRERSTTGNRYILSCNRGRLDITPMRRSNPLLRLGPTLIAAALQQQFGSDPDKGFATSLTVRSDPIIFKTRDKKGHVVPHYEKVVVQVSSAAAIRKYGFVHRNVFAHDAFSPAEVRAQGELHLTRVGLPTKTFNFTHPGIPSIRRGDAIRAILTDPVLSQIIFVTDARHTLNSTYQMEVSCVFIDPFAHRVQDHILETRAATDGQTLRATKHFAGQQGLSAAARRDAKAPATAGNRLTGRGAGGPHR